MEEFILTKNKPKIFEKRKIDSIKSEDYNNNNKLEVIFDLDNNDNNDDIDIKKIKGNSFNNEYIDKLMKHDTTLNELLIFYKEMKETTSSKQKIKILKEHPECVKLLYYIYHPYWHFFVKSERLKRIFNDRGNKFVKTSKNSWKTKCGDITLPDNIYDLLDLLKNRYITGNEAVDLVYEFIKENRRFQNIIYEIIDKNLKMRCNKKTINSVYKGLIPEFAVALAEPYADHIKRIDFVNDTWYASRKYDGVRLILHIDENGVCHFRSREGNYFYTLKPLENQFSNFPKRNVILDGEVCIMEENHEDFKKIVSEIKRDGHIIINCRFFVFDYISFEEFDKKKGTKLYSERLKELTEIYNQMCEENHDFSIYVSLVKEAIIKDDDHLQRLTAQAKDNDWEGLIIRKDVGYEGKRSNNMLKVKKFQEAEYICIGIESTKMRIVRNEEEIEIETMGNIIIDIGDRNKVSVGSGFTLAERNHFYKNPQDIINKAITVSYFDKSSDKNGKPSLRFPTFRCVHDSETRDI